MDEIDKKIKLSDTHDKKISLALMAPFLILTVQYFLLFNLNVFGSSGGTVIQVFSKILVGISFVYTLPIVIKRSLKKFIIVYSLSLSIWGLHYLVFPENQIYMNELIVPIFSMNLPMFVYSMSIQNLVIFKDIMIKSAFIIFVFGTLLAIQSFMGVVSIGTYSGPLANYMIIPAIVFLNQSFTRLDIKNLLIAVVSIIVIILLGSRGAMLGIIFFITMQLLFLFSCKIKSYKNLFGFSVMFFLLIISAIEFDRILNIIFNKLNNLGIYSRTIYLLTQEKIYLSGRDNIYAEILNGIIHNPIIGFGIAGDRRILQEDAVYAHNIVLEIVGNYGIPLGFIIIAIIIFLIFRGLNKKMKIKSEIILMWTSIGFIHLMISSSYLIEMKFWILLGLSLNNTQRRRY